MVNLLKVCSIAAILSLLIGPNEGFGRDQVSPPAHYGACHTTPERLQAAKNLVESAQKLYEEKGFEESLKIFTNQKGPYCTRYEHQYSGLIIWDLQGNILSYCKFPKLVGKNMLPWKCPDGVLLIPKILKKIEANPNGVFLPYVSNLNPHTNRPGPATLYARKVGNYIFGVPAYLVEPMHKDIHPQEDVATYT